MCGKSSSLTAGSVCLVALTPGPRCTCPPACRKLGCCVSRRCVYHYTNGTYIGHQTETFPFSAVRLVMVEARRIHTYNIVVAVPTKNKLALALELGFTG